MAVSLRIRHGRITRVTVSVVLLKMSRGVVTVQRVGIGQKWDSCVNCQATGTGIGDGKCE